MKVAADRRRDRAPMPPINGERRSRSPWKRLLLPLADIVAVSSAIYLAFALRLDEPFALNLVLAALPLAALPIVVRPTLNRLLGLWAHSWRYVSVPEITRLGVGVALGTLVMVGVYGASAFAWPLLVERFPRSFWILEAVLSFGLMTLVRFAPRVLADFRAARPAEHPHEVSRAILYGAGEAGAMMARGAVRQPSAGVRPVAFLDDDPQKWGTQHAGVLVQGGLNTMAEAKRLTGADLLLITMPSAPGEAIRRVAEAAIELGLRVRTIPSLDEMFNGAFDPQMTRPLRLEDLLRRPAVTPEAMAGLTSDLADEVVLVTGAAGSIGSELARQLHTVRPRRLVLLDRAEGPLYELQRDIERRQEGATERVPTVFQLADIANGAAMDRLVGAHRPTVIFHAAAYKHVSVMEEHPESAVEVNVGGTLALLNAAEEHGVERFVLVSTDKAVEPTGVMGASKRLAELLVAEYSNRLQRPWVSVRFGNVLGSSGSVVPIFQRQLENGEPLTITHEEMTRFFMTIPEAVHLILQAATMARAGDLFVLDMGQPVRILDLARDLIRLRGQRAERVPMTFTGLRPGERMHEQLFFSHEEVHKTAHPKVHRVHAAEPVGSAARAKAGTLLAMAKFGDESIRQELMVFVTQKAPPVATARRRRPVARAPMRTPPLRGNIGS
jgi:FlaA1/EpsC-like NDP-sugar epimerase